MKRIVLLFFFYLILYSGDLWGFEPARYSVKIAVAVQGNATCGNVNHYKLNFYETGNTTPIKVYDENLGHGEHVRRYSYTWEYGASQKISCNTEGRRRRNGTWGCIDATEDNKPTPITSIDMSNVATRTIQKSVPQWYGDGVTIYVFPKLIEIESSALSYDVRPPGQTNWNNAFPVEDLIRISVTPGFPSIVYQWQYSLDGGITWNSMSSSYNGKTSIDVCGKDLFGNKALEYVEKYKRITFRIKPPEVQSYKTNSESITLDMVPSAPHIKSLKPVNPKCFDSLDGSVIVYLDRKLIVGERLNFFIDSQLHSDISFNSSSDSAVLLNLAPKEYLIGLMGFYKNSTYEHTTYTEGNSHKGKATITAPPRIEFEVTDGGITHVLCYGNYSGSITVKASGGTPPYKLQWKRKNDATFSSTEAFNTTGELENLNADEYEFYVTDQNNCCAKEADGSPETKKVIIQQPAAGIEISTFSTTSPSGFGLDNGSITIQATGGQPYYDGMYTFCIWVNKQTGMNIHGRNEVINGRFRSTIENISAGIYTVIVKDQSGCDRSMDVILTQPNPFTASISVSRAISCKGESDGALSVRAQGGVGDVTSFNWYKRENGSFVNLYNFSSSIAQLADGEYKVELEDSSNPVNKTATTFYLSEPAIVEVSSYQIQDVTCYGESNGRITITAKGGSGGYRLTYKNKDSLVYQNVSAIGNNPTIVISNLPQGDYLFQLCDRNNCAASFADGALKLTIKQPDKPLVILPYGTTPISGYGRSDGALSYRVEDGTPNATSPEYTVVWKDSLNNLLPHTEKTENGVFITEIKDIPKGKYTLEVMDKNYQSVKNGCYATVVTALREPDPLTVDIKNPLTVNCHGDLSGELVADVKGGVPFTRLGLPYNFEWYQVVNGTDSLLSTQTDSIISNLGTGHYKVYVEDSSTPANTITSTVFHITEPPLLVTQLTSKNISCFGSSDGHIHISVSGGVGDYRMFFKKIDTDPDYQEQAIHTNDNTFYLDSLFSGTYSIYIIDGNNCSAKINGEDVYEITLTQPDEPLQITRVTMHDQSGYGIANGSIQLQIEGGTPKSDNSYYVIWEDENGNSMQEKASFNNGNYLSSIDGLTKGDYIIVVTDDNYASAYPGKGGGCFLTDTFTLKEPEKFVVTLNESHFVTCNGMTDGELIASATGGIRNTDEKASPYKYSWYKEVDGKYVSFENESANVLSTLTAGNYRIIVEDYSWITNRVVIDHQLKQPDKLIVAADDVSVMCGEFATIQAVITGGTPPYRYEWNTGDTTTMVADAVSGKYMIYVTDSRGCEASTIVRVTAPSNMNVTGITHDPACLGSSNGSIELVITGGQAPYIYKWSTGATTPVLNAVPAGNYTVIVSDQSGCSFFQSFVLKDPEAITVFAGEDRILCAGQEHEIIPVYDDPNSTCYWTGPSGFTSNKKQIKVKQPGTYKLTITDSNGCQATDEVTITTENQLISSEFVVSSQVFAGDTIVLVNISNPAPERIEWMVSESDSLQIVEKTDDFVRVIFKETGYYTVGLKTYVGDCYQEDLKSISVAPAGDKAYMLRESAIKAFQVSPNPNNGVFNVFVELSKVYTIRIRIISIGSGTMLHDQKYDGSTIYTLPYNIALASGGYVILLETEAGQMTAKMIIK
ncbi:MAG: SprB repeat-containing protein [Tannerellaceae bacterium]|jgi:hypothetical protein|nr:SprB repeat-containing protein [Tannerellaceae bacterium]